jgi:hypothetical protein
MIHAAPHLHHQIGRVSDQFLAQLDHSHRRHRESNSRRQPCCQQSFARILSPGGLFWTLTT